MALARISPRNFLHIEVWSRYAEKLSDLAKPENAAMAIRCLNEMITDALQHAPDVLKYLSILKNKGVFNYWASLQVIAIATLAACYNNKDMFRGIVKMQKEQAVTLMRDATNMQAVKAIMSQHLEEVSWVPCSGRYILF
ncbi:squalene synthase-like [Alligator mississippiensis]|uniref:squalene synthase-like n=1 Tax=Alligator mississippiensis TaxID=8496 RepID=UPI002877E29D|nr:squalene synthase-like [Alligator mississippiensis]